MLIAADGEATVVGAAEGVDEVIPVPGMTDGFPVGAADGGEVVCGGRIVGDALGNCSLFEAGTAA